MPTYKMLQIDDPIKAGDELWNPDENVWVPSVAWGSHFRETDMKLGYFYRRRDRRTYILVMAPDTNQDDQFESGLSVEVDKDGHMILDAGPDTIYVPVTYAQALIDAIKEVAGLE